MEEWNWYSNDVQRGLCVTRLTTFQNISVKTSQSMDWTRIRILTTWPLWVISNVYNFVVPTLETLKSVSQSDSYISWLDFRHAVPNVVQWYMYQSIYELWMYESEDVKPSGAGIVALVVLVVWRDRIKNSLIRMNGQVLKIWKWRPKGVQQTGAGAVRVHTSKRGTKCLTLELVPHHKHLLSAPPHTHTQSPVFFVCPPQVFFCVCRHNHFFVFTVYRYR